MNDTEQAVEVPSTFPDLAEVKGQEAAKLALEIAAAGNRPSPAIESLERASQVTEEELLRDLWPEKN